MQISFLAASNAFKNSPLDVIRVNKVIAEELRAKGHEVKESPIGDGGTDTLDAFAGNLGASAQLMTSRVLDPFGRRISAQWLHIPESSTAIIESAKATGLTVIKPDERNPLEASTYGTGELIIDALDSGCKNLKLTVGGSATVDAGMGMMKALGVVFKDESHGFLDPKGSNLKDIREIEIITAVAKLQGINIEFLSDVQTPLRSSVPDGENVMLYTKQKFRDDASFQAGREILDQGMDNIANIVDEMARKKKARRIASQEPTTGAGGGTPYIPLALFGATTYSGIERFAEMFDLEGKIQAADVVITGEGRLDKQTLEGKGPAEVIRLAKNHDKKVIVVCGSAEDRNWKDHGVDLVIKINPNDLPLAEAIAKTEELLRAAIRANMSLIEAL
jgi:glycerate kinase